MFIRYNVIMLSFFILFILFCAFAVLFYLCFNLCLQFFHPAICHTDGDLLYSFDDGPSVYTPQILEILKQHNQKAIFFCIGKNIATHPEIFAEILAHGHQVGNHSYTHSNFFGFKSVKNIIAEIQDTDDIMKKYGAVEVRYFRPPFGVINPTISKALKRTGHSVMGWSVRSFDTVFSEKIVLKRLKNSKKHDIILLHDSLSKTKNILKRDLK